MFERIMVAIDESDPATPAIAVGAELARVLGACLALVHVVDPAPAANLEAGLPAGELLDEVRQTDSELLRAVRAQFSADLAPETFLREGRPAQEILTAAQEWGAQLIVIGARHHSRLGHLLWRDTAEALVHEATCAVLTVPAAGASA